LGAGDSGIHCIAVCLITLELAKQCARLVRAQVLQLRSMAYVDAAQDYKAHPAFTLCGSHMLPNVLPSILVTLSFAVPAAIFTEAFLSFIGLGCGAARILLGLDV
jgi:oligopeptide transport system permease protein